MNRFRIESVHTVNEDSYTEGEGEFVNEWYQNKTLYMQSDDVKDAIEKFYKIELHMEYVPENTEIDGHMLFDSRMVDADNNVPSESDIEKWKRGEIPLYVENITLYVYKLEPIDLEKML